MRKIVILLLFLFLIQVVYAIGGSIRPPTIIYNVKILSGVVNTVDGFIEVGNPNSYPINVTISTPNFIEVLNDSRFELQPNETRVVNFTAAVTRWGNYDGDIAVLYTAQRGMPLTLTSSITLSAVTNGTGLNNNPPSSPQLISPLGAIIDKKVQLIWNESSDSDGNKLIYYYYVDNNSDFSSPEYSGWTLKTMKKIEIAGGTYYWKIVAFDGKYYNSSEVWGFTTNMNPPAPVLLSPPNKASLETEPILSWTNVTDFDGDNITYNLFVYNETDLIINEILSTNFFILSNLSSGKYYWFVRSSDGKEESESDVWYFYLCKDETGCTKIEINSPLNKTYDSRRILINVTIDKKVKYIYRALNSNRFSKMCSNCDSFSYRASAREGENNLTIMVIDYENNTINKTVNFIVDTKKPQITKTYPKNKQYVSGTNFSVKYSEDYLEGITLVLDGEEINLTNCSSGRNKECSIDIDLSEYDNQTIDYHFVVRDHFRNISSKNFTITVDTTLPVVKILSPLNQTYGNRVNVAINVSEKVEKLEKSENGKKFTTLCRKCNYYNRTLYYRDGIYNLTIRATDKAGDVGYDAVIFSVV